MKNGRNSDAQIMAALKGDRTMSELATQFDLHPNQIKQWKDQLLDGFPDVFDDKLKSEEPEIDVTTLYAKIGQLTLENDFSDMRNTATSIKGALRIHPCFYNPRRRQSALGCKGPIAFERQLA